jgi:uncharacterized protein YcaQ
MTAGRSNGQHLYDLTERVVPEKYLHAPKLSYDESILELVMERHRAMGLVRPSAPYEVWSYKLMGYTKRQSIAELARRGEIIPINVEGMEAHATPTFLSLLDQPSLPPRVAFIAPLDQLMWDRKMIGHVFGFDYIWEIYKPESLRKWGYYVLPILHGDRLVARAEFYCRNNVLEVREWHAEEFPLKPAFWNQFEKAIIKLMNYCSATEALAREHVDDRVKEVLAAARGS